MKIYNPVATPGDFKHTATDTIEIDGGTTDNIDVPGQRISFSIKKSLKKEPNSSDITVTNLSPTTRGSLQQKGVQVLLEAGYKASGLFRIFSGDVRTVDHVRNGPNWDSTFRLGDGERAYLYSRIHESFSPGTLVSDAIKTVANRMGIGKGNVDEQVGSVGASLDQGFAVAGSCSKAMDQLMKMIGKTWSIQDGEIQILDPYGTLNLPIPEITPDTGLIGSPEMGSPPTKKHPALVKFKSLLIATKPGAKVKLISARYRGYVQVRACTFTGDTAGGEWYTEISGLLSQ